MRAALFRPPTQYYRRERQRCFLASVLCFVLLLAMHPSLTSQDYTGEYLLTHQGTEVMGIKIRQTGNGRISGVVSSGGEEFPLSGSLRNDRLEFTTTAGGAIYRWEAALEGDNLRTTITDSAGERETYILTGRAAGWTADSPLAQQWERRLTGRAFTITERTGGGSSGGAVKDVTFAFCAGGKSLLEERFTLNVTVPGMGGSQTSHEAEGARWRVLTSGGSVSVELTSKDGGPF